MPLDSRLSSEDRTFRQPGASVAVLQPRDVQQAETIVRTSTSTRLATICQVLHTLEVGGAEVLAARLARRLKRHYRCLFICLDELGSLGRALRDEGFPIEVLSRRPGLDMHCARRLAEIVRRERVDVLHAHQ